MYTQPLQVMQYLHNQFFLLFPLVLTTLYKEQNPQKKEAVRCVILIGENDKRSDFFRG